MKEVCPMELTLLKKLKSHQLTLVNNLRLTLKPEALKEIDITKEYTLRFRMKIANKTPQDLAVETATDDGAYRIKILCRR